MMFRSLRCAAWARSCRSEGERMEDEAAPVGGSAADRRSGDGCPARERRISWSMAHLRRRGCGRTRISVLCFVEFGQARRAGAPLVGMNTLGLEVVADAVEDKDDDAEKLESTHVLGVEGGGRSLDSVPGR